jgi:signal transduction histidine kinase/HAMP domain-containing protein
MKSLRNRITLLLGFATALALAVVAFVQLVTARDGVDRVNSIVVTARLDQVTDAVHDVNEANQRKVAAVTRWAHVDSATLRRVLVDGDPDVAFVDVVDRTGTIAASSQAEHVGQRVYAPLLRRVLMNGTPQSEVAGPNMAYAAPMGRAGDIDGVVIMMVPISALARDLAEVQGAGINAMLTDESGQTLWHAPSLLLPGAGGAMTVTRRVPGTQFDIVASVTGDAGAGELRGVMLKGLAVCALLLALTFTIKMLMVRRAFRPLDHMRGAAKQVAAGNYDARIPLGGFAELDSVATVFNSMAASLADGKARLEEAVAERTRAMEAANQQLANRNAELAERSEELAQHRYHEQAKGRALAALTADAELDEVVGAALSEMAGPVGAAVMICYRLEGAELVPVASYAASEQARTTTVPLAGMAEQALRKGRIETLEGLPGQIPLRFDCLIAAGTPSALALVPLKVGNRPTGLLAVGALARLQTDAATMLMDLAAPLALTMARRSLLDHTERIARELARRNEELRTQAEALEAQGEELKAQQQELSIKNKEVEKADKLKSEFLANMSHELRTPLNAVIGFSDLLLEDKATLNTTQQQWVGDIQESGKHLLMLINRVLDLAKIEAGRTSFHLEALDPADLLAGAQTLVRPSAKKRNIEIGVVESPARAVQGDRGHLHQVLINLLANAVKFSPEGASVQVGFAEETEEPALPATGGARTRAAPIGQVRFWVTDHGPGIDEETQRRLFEPFFQAESPLVKKHEGTGLGLAISRKLIEGMGGHIGVQSAPGAGSTFFFTLPLAGAQPAQDFTQGAAQPLSYDKEAPLVLVVDDHDLNRQVAREMLERRGCRVILARDGEEGVQRARQDHPRLVLLDLAMPRKDGFAVARELKMDPQTAQTPLVALTALAMRGDDERVLQAGFDGYLPKPLERAALDATLARIFAN